MLQAEIKLVLPLVFLFYQVVLEARPTLGYTSNLDHCGCPLRFQKSKKQVHNIV